MILLFLLLLVPSIETKETSFSFCFNDGDVMSDWSGDGSTYYQCVDNGWVRRFCAPNYRFDPESRFCVYNSITTTRAPRPPRPPQRECRPGSRKPNVFDNTTYFECAEDGNSFIKRFCQPGATYIQQLTMCVSVQPTTTITTSRRPPTTTTPFYGPCKEDSGASGFKPDIYNCKNYYQCASGVWIQRSCPVGTIWEQSLLVCDHNRGQCRPRPRPTPPTATTTVGPWPPGPYPGPPAPPPDYSEVMTTTTTRRPIEVKK